MYRRPQGLFLSLWETALEAESRVQLQGSDAVRSEGVAGAWGVWPPCHPGWHRSFCSNPNRTINSSPGMEELLLLNLALALVELPQGQEALHPGDSTGNSVCLWIRQQVLYFILEPY